MKEELRKLLVTKLWEGYKTKIPFYQKIFVNDFVHLDHFAIIDLPSPNSGIKYLSKILSKIGFALSGEGYLADKQNDFVWMREENFLQKEFNQSTAQAVIADFRLSDLSHNTKNIVEKYAAYSQSINFDKLKFYEEQIDKSDYAILEEAAQFLYSHLIQKSWPDITTSEYNQISQENELLAWVLVYGRVVNHFGISINLLNLYNNLNEFNYTITQNFGIKLNSYPNAIKGGKHCGIAQSSTEGEIEEVCLKDGKIKIRGSFLEFVWRYSNKKNPKIANDYYLDFIPHNANYVIESLYEK